jgi:two-component system, sensor histidine kinase and response regulator
MDGLELARQITADPTLAKSALVLLTSAVDVGPEQARQSGIVACLAKPVRASQLYDCLMRLTAPARGGPEAIPEAAKPRSIRGHVLVAEDNATNQMVALGILAKLGYRADVAANGLEALHAVARTDYAAVLMDCQMPEMDGYAATAEIRARERDATHIPIIAMTAAATKGEREKCLAAGMDDYVSKPVSLDELENALGRRVEPGETDLADAPATNRGVTPATFDPQIVAALRSLSADGEQDAFVSLTTLFVASGAGLLETLREALGRGDTESVGHAAHTLKGSAANLGATRLSDACRQLEVALPSGMEVVGAAVARVEAEFGQVQAWLGAAPGSTLSESVPEGGGG